MGKEKSAGTKHRESALPKIASRDLDAHKGDFGHVLVVAGSRGMTGAACLVSMSALRSGAGLVTLAVPKSLQPIVASQMTCVMTIPCEETPEGTFSEAAAGQVIDFAEKCDAVALGPGVGGNQQAAAMVRRIFTLLKKPLVVDADGLNALAHDPDVLEGAPTGRPTVLTPHPGEMAGLCLCTVDRVQSDRIRCAQHFAGDHSVALILKGGGSVVAEGERLFVCKTGNPGMATAGAGDVLTGIVAAFLAQGFPAFEAAQLGAHIHGLAGDAARLEFGEVSMTADDILDCLPAAFKKFTGKKK